MATSRAQRAAQQLDEHWYHLRIRDVDLPGKHLLRLDGQLGTAGEASASEPSGGSVTLSEAVSIYLHLKGKDRPVTFRRAAERSCGYHMHPTSDFPPYPAWSGTGEEFKGQPLGPSTRADFRDRAGERVGLTEDRGCRLATRRLTPDSSRRRPYGAPWPGAIHRDTPCFVGERPTEGACSGNTTSVWEHHFHN